MSTRYRSRTAAGTVPWCFSPAYSEGAFSGLLCFFAHATCAAPVHPCLPACLQVKLKDVADYVSDILAYTAASSAADALLAPAGDAIAARLKSEGANCGGLGGGMGSDGGPKLGSSCGWSAACY